MKRNSIFFLYWDRKFCFEIYANLIPSEKVRKKYDGLVLLDLGSINTD